MLIIGEMYGNVFYMYIYIYIYVYTYIYTMLCSSICKANKCQQGDLRHIITRFLSMNIPYIYICIYIEYPTSLIFDTKIVVKLTLTVFLCPIFVGLLLSPHLS